MSIGYRKLWVRPKILPDRFGNLFGLKPQNISDTYRSSFILLVFKNKF